VSVLDALAGDFSRSHNFAKIIAKVKIETGVRYPSRSNRSDSRDEIEQTNEIVGKVYVCSQFFSQAET